MTNMTWHKIGMRLAAAVAGVAILAGTVGLSSIGTAEAHSPPAGFPRFWGQVNCEGDHLFVNVEMQAMPLVFAARNIVSTSQANSQAASFTLHLFKYSQSAGWIWSGISKGPYLGTAHGGGGAFPIISDSPRINFPGPGYYKVAIEYRWLADATHGSAYWYEWANKYYDPYLTTFFIKEVPYCSYGMSN